MTYSYTQISHYLGCPRRYRYRYLEGWHERDSRPGLLFGRSLEKALSAYFRREDAGAVWSREWSVYRQAALQYSSGDSWDRLLHCGVQLLDRFSQEDRVRIRRPGRQLQMKFTKSLSRHNAFVAYIDAVGELDGVRCVIDWKTSAARYPESPAGLLALDPQLLSYSWITGEAAVAFVVFVRKRCPEIQYLRATITDAQRSEFDFLVRETVEQIEAARFPGHGGIRFPQNACLSCAYVGLCLGDQLQVERALMRRPGGDLGWLDELAD